MRAKSTPKPGAPVTAPNPGAPVIAEDVLNSWKEIASYVNRGVRTVQRWEAELGLPIRRPRGRTRSAVIALRSDIDRWLKSCPVIAREQVAIDVPPGDKQALARSLVQEVERSRWLRNDLRRNRQDFRGALSQLIRSVETMKVPQANADPERGTNTA